jgi:hypothetical protein
MVFGGAINLALQAGVRPRRFSFFGWTTNPDGIAKIYAGLKEHAGTLALIQVVPDLEAQIFARDIASVLSANGWQIRFVSEKESDVPDLSLSEGVSIYALADGKTDHRWRSSLERDATRLP